MRRRDFLGADVAEHRDIVAQTLTSAFRECGKDFFLHAFGGTFERERQLRRIHFAHEALHVAGAQAGKILEREQFSTHRSRESGIFLFHLGHDRARGVFGNTFEHVGHRFGAAAAVKRGHLGLRNVRAELVGDLFDVFERGAINQADAQRNIRLQLGRK